MANERKARYSPTKMRIRGIVGLALVLFVFSGCGHRSKMPITFYPPEGSPVSRITAPPNARVAIINARWGKIGAFGVVMESDEGRSLSPLIAVLPPPHTLFAKAIKSIRLQPKLYHSVTDVNGTCWLIRKEEVNGKQYTIGVCKSVDVLLGITNGVKRFLQVASGIRLDKHYLKDGMQKHDINIRRKKMK